MPFAFIIPAAATLIGASMSSNAAKGAAQTTSAAADKATELQRQIYEESVARQKPFLDIGTEYTNRLAALLRGGPEAQQQFLQMDPGYGFRLSEGQKALDRQAAARGGLISGAALKAAQRYGQEMGSQEFQNAFNRYGTLASLGPSAAGVTNTLGQTMASNIGNIYTGQAGNVGNMMLARGSTYGRALGDIGQLYGRTNPNFGSLFGGGNPYLPGGSGYGSSDEGAGWPSASGG